MSVKSKIFLSFSVLVVLFILNGVATIITLNKNKQLAENTMEVIMPSSDALDSLTLMLVESKMYATNWVFLRYNDDDKQSLRLIEDAQYQALKQKLALYQPQWNNTRWADSLQEIQRGFEELLAVDRRIMQSLKSFQDYDDPVVKLSGEQLVEDEVLPRSAALLHSLNSLNESIKLAGQRESTKRVKACIALRTEVILLAIAIILAGLFLSLYMTGLIIRPINRMRAIVNDLGRGVIRPIQAGRNQDEIGSMIQSINNLSGNLRATADFARNIGAKNFSVVFQPLSDEDTLGKALIAMRDNLRASEEELNEAALHLRKKDQILEAVGSATHELVSNIDFDQAIGRSIRLLGLKIPVDGVNVFKAEREAGTDEWHADQVVRWTSQSNEIEHNLEEFQNIRGISHAVSQLARGEVHYYVPKHIDDPELRAYFERRGIKSSAGIPIFLGEEFWGFVTLNDHLHEREWSHIELSVLRSFAALLGAAIQRMQMEAALVVARDKAEAASVAKSEFMANMSHELRTPMNAIIGFTDLVLTTEMQKTQRDYLKNVRKGAYNLLNIINDILDFSKIEAGKLALEEAPFSLLQLLEDTVDMMSIKAEEKRLELICDIDRGLPSSFIGDEVRIRQILINLLGNAIKFTGKGEITVLVRCKEAAGRGGRKHLDIAISDTGIGISADKLDMIFESFTQADSSTTRKYGGTGLGLSISKRLATMMGGDLLAESVLGKGSTFTLQLQLTVANESPSITFSDRPSLRHVLVVDDNYTNCHLMQGIFRHLDIPCKIALNGYDALAEVTQAMDDGEPFDLIITDHQMPVMDGISLVKKIKKTIHGKVEPFILMLSSLEKTVYQHEAEDIGINKFLSKPVKLHELEALLGNIFKEGGSRKPETVREQQLAHFGKPAKVLVVEDEPINMLLISEVLGRMGLDVIKASNGREAIGTVAENDIALIFMDVNMPDLDGYSATRIIRGRKDRKRDIPIIALTADALPEDKEKCLSSGMNDYLAKPFRLEELQTLLKQYLLAN
ncbi:MAG TPA: response regulator [Puia sp.]|nr:response regulator [Puia sp.]